jgi:hypothetical protein
MNNKFYFYYNFFLDLRLLSNLGYRISELNKLAEE